MADEEVDHMAEAGDTLDEDERTRRKKGGRRRRRPLSLRGRSQVDGPTIRHAVQVTTYDTRSKGSTTLSRHEMLL